MRKRLRVPYEFVVLVAAVLYFSSLQVVAIYPYWGYWGQNGGIAVSTPAGCIGLEVKGHVGFFGGWDPGACDI